MPPFRHLLLIALWLAACQPQPRDDGTRAGQPIVSALAMASATATTFKLTAGQNGNGTACLAWSGVEAAAAPAASILAQALSSKHFSSIPALKWDATICSAAVQEPMVTINATIDTVLRTGFATATQTFGLWQEELRRKNCRAWTIAGAAISYADALVGPILDALGSGLWTVEVEAIPLPLDACM